MEFKTNFTVLPKDCNYMTPLIFGGEFMARLDLAAAQCVTNLLQETDTEADNAVTHKANFEFVKPSYMGDTIYILCTVTETRHKAIVVSAKAWRKPRTGKNPESILVALAEFVFVTRKGEEYINHNIKI